MRAKNRDSSADTWRIGWRLYFVGFRSLRKSFLYERKRGGREMVRILRPTIIASAVVPIFAGGAIAQEDKEDEKKLGWSNVADLVLVVTAGNAPTSTFTFEDDGFFTVTL